MKDILWMRATSGARGGPSRGTMRLNPLGWWLVLPTRARRPPILHTAGRRPSPRGAWPPRAWCVAARRPSRQLLWGCSPLVVITWRHLSRRLAEGSRARRGLARSAGARDVVGAGLPDTSHHNAASLATRDAKPATGLTPSQGGTRFAAEVAHPTASAAESQGLPEPRSTAPLQHKQRPWPRPRSTGPRTS